MGSQAHRGSLVNSIKYLRKKLYKFSTSSFRGEKQREYFLTHAMRPALPNIKTKDISGKQISLMNIDVKIFSKIIANQIQQCIKGIVHHH